MKITTTNGTDTILLEELVQDFVIHSQKDDGHTLQNYGVNGPVLLLIVTVQYVETTVVSAVNGDGTRDCLVVSEEDEYVIRVNNSYQRQGHRDAVPTR
jgi:hypothetical protein